MNIKGANRNDDASEWGSVGSINEVDSESNNVERFSNIEDEEYLSEEYLSEDFDERILDEDTLLQIKSNDPKVTSIAVHRFDHCIGRKDVGHFIGENPYLKKLLVEGESMAWDERTSYMFGRFCKGLAQNRSIKDLSISLCELSVEDVSVTRPPLKKLQYFTIARLAQFCGQNINLQSLKIDCCDLGDKSTRVLAMVLARKSNKRSLQRINLFDNQLGDAAAKELIESLEGFDNLEELSLGNNLIGTRGCTALRNLISRPMVNLKRLNLQNNKIDDNGIAILTRAFSGDLALKEVDLGFNCDVTPSGWQLFFNSLKQSSSSIEQLRIGSNNIPDEAVATLGNALANNKSLKVLDFSTNHIQRQPTCITTAGWRSFFACLYNSKSALQEIILRGCSITAEGLELVANAFNTNSTLKILDISDNPQGNVAAWRRFFTTCLQSPGSSLDSLSLCENLTEKADEVMADLADAVANNEVLDAIDLGENPSITGSGWSHFSRLLCDKSSVTSIYESNHVLNYLGPRTQRMPLDLEDCMCLNVHENKKEVAREKILRYHFRYGVNIQEFSDMKIELLPRAISWLGRDCSWTGRENSGRTPLYELLRSLPSLFEPKNTAVAGKKRKRLAIGCPRATKLKPDRTELNVARQLY